MATGLLEVSATLEVEQFWPGGTSDADTAKVVVAADAFRFRPNASAPFTVTHVFDGATIKGKTTKPVIDAKSRVTVRLQGIDAPELHYMPQALKKRAARTKQQDQLFFEWNFNFRQRLGETAAEALGQLLGSIGPNALPCTVTTAVDHPNDAFDTYGRLVGDIVVERNGHPFNVNRWLLDEGWAFPTYYNSMSRDEIKALQHIADAAAKSKKRAWKLFRKPLGSLDFTLQEPKKGDPLDPKDGKPPVIMPKLFRRQVTFEVNRKAKMAAGSFEKFLTDHPDRCYSTDDFLIQGVASASPHRLNEFVKNGAFSVGPGDLVFREDPSVLVVPGGGPIQW
jgi:endonuclease YncB( thermonuclease family)